MLPFALVAGLAVAPTQQQPQQPVRLDLATDTARQVVVDREAGQYLGHVSTVLLDDGATILAVYPKGHGKGAIVMKRSRDGGRTWSERLPVPANWAMSQEVPTIWRMQDAAGLRRLILWSGLHPARLAHSADNGDHWSDLQPAGDWGGIVVMGDVASTATPGRYLAWFHDDGRFLRAANATTRGTFTLLQTETDDGGLSWRAPRAIWSGRELHLCEPGAIRSPDGKELALLLRENARRAQAHVMFTRDDGAAWSAPQPLHAALTGDRHTVRRAGDGRIVAAFRSMPLVDDIADQGTKGDFVAWVGSYDDLHQGGAGQYRVRLLDNQDGFDCGYPGLEVLADGTLVATTYGHWQEGEPPFVISTRFSLAELDALAAARAIPAATAAAGATPTAASAAPSGDLAADLATLEAYTPTAKAPTDATIVAATEHLMKAMRKLTIADDLVSRRLDELLTARRDELVPSAKNKIHARDPLARVLVRYDDERTLHMRVDKLRAHPSAAAFPGAPPAGTLPIPCGRVVDLRVPGRHSLGVYARAGSVVTMRFGNGEALPDGLRVRIGAHSDDIARREAWPRMPRISRTFAIDRAELHVGNAYGGLVYIEVQKTSDAQLDVLLDNTVPAPLFELGVTKLDDWRKFEQPAPAPWAELVTDKVALTVPSEAIRNLDDPTELLQFWNRILDGAADLAARPRVRERAERYVADIEISAGAMHSGYPIMTHLGAVPDMVDPARLRKGPWGLFHELGHNHQSRDWTFAGTGEVTVNIFSLYLCHILCDLSWDQAWGGNLLRAQQRLAESLRAGKKPWGDDGEGKPDLALRLLMYSQIERGFGWEAYMHTFADYRALPKNELPKSDADKRDRWLVMLSQAIDRDLGPFFAAWGVPVSDAARQAIRGRTVWMPDDWPQ